MKLSQGSVEQIAAGRQEARSDLIARMRETLREWADEATVLHPLPHGTFYEQIRFEISDVEAEREPNGHRAFKKTRNKVAPATRERVFKRDRYTCQECGWRRPDDIAERNRAYRAGRFFVAWHVISTLDGGSNSPKNLTTLCSFCAHSRGGGVNASKEQRDGVARDQRSEDVRREDG